MDILEEISSVRKRLDHSLSMPKNTYAGTSDDRIYLWHVLHHLIHHEETKNYFSDSEINAVDNKYRGLVIGE